MIESIESDTPPTRATFACNHQGPPHPLPPEHWDPYGRWPPERLSNQLCYDCSLREVREWTEQYDAKVADMQAAIDEDKRLLVQDTYNDPSPDWQRILHKTQEKEREKKSWARWFTNARERWLAVWGVSMPAE